MAEGPAAAPSEHPGGDFGFDGREARALVFSGAAAVRARSLNQRIRRASSDIQRTSAEHLPLRQINGANRRPD